MGSTNQWHNRARLGQLSTPPFRSLGSGHFRIGRSGNGGNVSTPSNINKTKNARTTFGSVLENYITTQHEYNQRAS